MERHYDDETLIELLGNRALDPTRDPHIAVCRACAENLHSYREITEVLAEETAWVSDLRLDPVPQTIALLRQFATATATEEETASEFLRHLQTMPETRWAGAIDDALEVQTPSMVQVLITESERLLHSFPAQALAFARMAVGVGRRLIAEAYPIGVVRRSQGAACRQLGFVAFYVGDYGLAAEALAEAQSALEDCQLADYELARLATARSLLFAVQERYSEAMGEARRSAATFLEFGDRSRYASARMAEAFSLLCQQRYRDALPILQAIDTDYRADVDHYARANVITNLAICYAELGRVPDAFDHYRHAVAILEELGNATEAVRLRYNVADLLAANGRHADAKLRYREVQDEFERLGMIHMAVSAGLDLAELLIAEKSYAEAELLCSRALRQFERMGLGASSKASTALIFLREAAAERRATPDTAKHVREYIERLPKEPTLLFAPPPLPPS